MGRQIATSLRLLRPINRLERKPFGYRSQGPIDVGTALEAKLREYLMLDCLEPELVRIGIPGTRPVQVQVLLMRTAWAALMLVCTLAVVIRLGLLTSRDRTRQNDAPNYEDQQ